MIRPHGDEYTKAVGGSIVMTCSVSDINTTLAASDISLVWFDNKQQQIPGRAGRSVVSFVISSGLVSRSYCGSLTLTSALTTGVP